MHRWITQVIKKIIKVKDPEKTKDEWYSEEMIPINGIDAMDLSVVFDVSWEVGDHVKEETVRIRATQEQREKMIVQKKGNEWKLRLKSGSFNGVAMHIALKRLSKVKIQGAGDSRGEIHTQEIEVNLSGAGDVNWAGSVERLRLEKSGSGNVNFEALTAGEAIVRGQGVGNMSLWVENKIEGTISGVIKASIKKNTSTVGQIEVSGVSSVCYKVSGTKEFKSRNSS